MSNDYNFSPQPVSPDYTHFSLDTVEPVKQKKQPRRILHFSDGVLEEYSTDEEEDHPPPPQINAKTLTWGPYFQYLFRNAGGKTLNAADFCGEKLAWFFGITSPKYQSAIDEFYRMKAEEEREEASEKRLEQLELSSVDVREDDVLPEKGSGSGDASFRKF